MKGHHVLGISRLCGRMDRDQTPLAPVEQEYWMMYFDGSLMKSGARVGLVFISLLDVRIRYMI
jgi:hypothetical protein